MTHPEILTHKELKELRWWQMAASAVPIFLIASLPLATHWHVKIRSDPESNRHLLKRIWGVLIVSAPVFLYTNSRTRTIYQTLSAKYLTDLSDYELVHFNTFYRQIKTEQQI